MSEKLNSLKKFNLIMGMFHFIQGIIMLVISLNVEKVANFKPQIVSYFLTFDSTQMRLVTEQKELFLLPYGILVSVFLFLSALFYFIVVSKTFNKKYNEQITNNMNSFRWYEYSISSSIMIVLISVLFGIYDIGALLLIFGLNASMNLFGLLMEKLNQYTKKTDWSPFIYGSIAGVIPWIVIIMYAFGNSNPAEVPWFVYAIFGSYFVFFNLFPINMILQYKKVGKMISIYNMTTFAILYNSTYFYLNK